MSKLAVLRRYRHDNHPGQTDEAASAALEIEWYVGVTMAWDDDVLIAWD